MTTEQHEKLENIVKQFDGKTPFLDSILQQNEDIIRVKSKEEKGYETPPELTEEDEEILDEIWATLSDTEE